MNIWPGQPFPLGATYHGTGTNFSLYSEVAEAVELCLFDEAGNEKRVELPEVTDSCWHGHLPGVKPGQCYGFRVHGSGCHPSKLLLDPYAGAVWGDVTWDPALFPTRPAGRAGAADDADSAPYVPRSVVVDPWFDWGDDRPPGVASHESIIYATDVRRLTARHPGVAEELRGTYTGLAEPAVVEHLVGLGVTAVGLAPVHQFVDAGRAAPERRAGSARDPLAFFAPHNGYAAWSRPGQVVQEFRQMVKTLHAAGIEVLLDVVYHRTAEAGAPPAVLSLRGIDAGAYYGPETGSERLNLRHPAVLRMVMDSLRYWIEGLRVDGFRFVSAPALARQFGGDDGVAAFFGLLQQDPVISRVKLVVDPGDGGGDDRLGRFPARWSEWNHRYRDCIRDYWSGRRVALPDLAHRLAGSPDLYEGIGRPPSASVNFVTTHDGLPLADLVSESPGGHAARARRARSLLATLLLSQGVPLLSGGDEMGRTRGHDGAPEGDGSGYDWDAADETMVDFTRRLIAVRRRHPLLVRRDSLRGRPLHGEACADFAWFSPGGKEIPDAGWPAADSATVAVFLNGESIRSLGPRGERVVDDSFLVLFNASDRPVRFTLPTGWWGRRWSLVYDTGAPEDEEGACSYRSGDAILVADRSLVLLRRTKGGHHPTTVRRGAGRGATKT